MTTGHTADVTVPLLDLQAQYQPIRDEILRAITRVCDDQRFIMGPEVDALERELAGMLETSHAIAVSSGTLVSINRFQCSTPPCAGRVNSTRS